MEEKKGRKEQMGEIGERSKEGEEEKWKVRSREGRRGVGRKGREEGE